MGFKPEVTVHEITYDDFPGLSLTAYEASLGELADMGEMPLSMNPQDAAKRFEMFEKFASYVVTWNIDHPVVRKGGACGQCGLTEGQPLPTTGEALRCLGFPFVLKLIFGWVTGMTRLSVPKELNSSDGEMKPEDLMKQLAQLQSPPKLPTRS